MLDTDIFSEILRGRDRIVAFREREYRAEWGKLTISAVTVMEVVRGSWSKRQVKLRSNVEAAFAVQEVLPFSNSTADLAGKMAARLDSIGRPIGFPDSMIAATAIEHDLVLVTGNTANFERIRQLGFPLRLANWREADS